MNIDFNKMPLVPAIIQNDITEQVLMLGYMNEEAFLKTREEKKVTFYSRSKKRLWTKGETSGNYLFVKDIRIDCDRDTILVKARPKGPTCHTGSSNCFGIETSKGFLYQLEQKISERIVENSKKSYTNSLFRSGINKVSQKVGEEAVELIIEAKDNHDQLFKNEAADLLYHFLILLKAKDVSLEEVENVLLERNSRYKSENFI